MIEITSTVGITRAVAARVLALVDYGLSRGLGIPEPGKMCIEAAVCYALGLPHGDNPPCVSPVLRSLKIRLNDVEWSSEQARARGLRRLAVAQLGSAGVLDEREFVKRVVDIALRKSAPSALRIAASVHKEPKHQVALLEAADKLEKEANKDAALGAKNAAAYAASSASLAAAYAAYAAAASAAAAYAATADAYAAYAAAYAADADAYAYATPARADAAKKRDEALAAYAEKIVQVLIEMKAPGCQWLDLTEIAA